MGKNGYNYSTKTCTKLTPTSDKLRKATEDADEFSQKARKTSPKVSPGYYARQSMSEAVPSDLGVAHRRSGTLQQTSPHGSPGRKDDKYQRLEDEFMRARGEANQLELQLKAAAQAEQDNVVRMNALQQENANLRELSKHARTQWDADRVEISDLKARLQEAEHVAIDAAEADRRLEDVKVRYQNDYDRMLEQFQQQGRQQAQDAHTITAHREPVQHRLVTAPREAVPKAMKLHHNTELVMLVHRHRPCRRVLQSFSSKE